MRPKEEGAAVSVDRGKCDDAGATEGTDDAARANTRQARMRIRI
jgi:hypothetical protein